MKLRLFPRDEKFFKLFREDAANVLKGVEALRDLVEHYDDVEKKYQAIKDIEHQGDKLTHDIITKLRETFITPFEREDIHALISGLDDVLDCVEGVASRMHYFHVAQPTPEMKKLVDILAASAQQIYEAISHLESMGHVSAFCREVNNLEYLADCVCREAIGDLFEKTERVDQLKELIKLKEIYGRLERAADRCEDVANVIEGIIVKSS